MIPICRYVNRLAVVSVDLSFTDSEGKIIRKPADAFRHGSLWRNQKNLISAFTPDRVTTGRCNLDFFRGGSKVKVNIGNHDFWINSLKRSRPQYVVALDNEQNGKFNLARM